MAVVHHSNYIRYFETARSQMMEDWGFPIQRCEKELGVEFLFETPAKKIIMEDGKAAGVIAVDKDGEEVEICAYTARTLRGARERAASLEPGRSAVLSQEIRVRISAADPGRTIVLKAGEFRRLDF